MRIVERHPSTGVHMHRILPLRLLEPKGKHKIGEPPIGLIGTSGTVGAIGGAPWRFRHVIIRGSVADRVLHGIVISEVTRLDVAEVQKAKMGGVNVAFKRL